MSVDIAETWGQDDRLELADPFNSLPKTLRTKLFHRRIIRDKRRALNDRLCGEDAIKWVAMLDCEPACFESMLI